MPTYGLFIARESGIGVPNGDLLLPFGLPNAAHYSRDFTKSSSAPDTRTMQVCADAIGIREQGTRKSYIQLFSSLPWWTSQYLVEQTIHLHAEM
jgi:hypothetical protein